MSVRNSYSTVVIFIYYNIVVIFQSGSKCWTDQQVDIATTKKISKKYILMEHKVDC